MTHRLLRSIFLPAMVCLSLSASAEISFSSGTEQVALLELYSSEGCSSCPPADRWLTGLLEHEQLFTEIIPIAFQVDYWDYIGWQDPYADPKHSKRQRKFARAGYTSGVYTPGMFLNGREWRNWRRGKNPVVYSPHVGDLVLEKHLDKPDAKWNLTFDSSKFANTKLNAHIVLLGFDLSTRVSRGENAGKKLSHDFVVLEWNTKRLNDSSAQFASLANKYPGKKLAIAAWVSTQDQTPVQATGGWLTP